MTVTEPDRFDKWSKTYDRAALRPLYERAHQGVLDLAYHWKLNPARMLDVGCGTGRLLGSFAQRYPQAALVGVDRSPGMLAAARANRCSERIAFCNATVEQLPFADAVFHLVTATASYRHWTDKDAGLREIARVLAPGTPLLIGGLFGPVRTALVSRTHHGLPHPLTREALARIGMNLECVRPLAGFGPIPEITLVAAVRR
jgi:ubiquinone/menaquinone biosynthesis C-methylase UbiE